jgi:hypothetical protein
MIVIKYVITDWLRQRQSPGYAGGARDVVAKHIIELSKRGILDRHHLSADAVAYLANTYRYERVVDPRRKAALC